MNRIARLQFLVVLLSPLFACSCGPGVQEGPENDSDDVLADGGGATDDFDTRTGDTEPEGFCVYPTILPTVALSASDFSADSTFVSISSNCALASRAAPDGYTATAAFMSAHIEDKVLCAFEHTVPLEPKDLSCGFDPVEKIYVAYILVSEGDLSIVYELVDETGEWTEVYRSETRLVGIHRLVRTAEPAIDEICVFGDGVTCASKDDGPLKWREEIPAGNGAFIFDISLISCDRGWCPVAVGRAGHIYIEQQSGWERQPVETAEDLLTVSASNDVFTAAGTGGVMLHGNAKGVDAYSVLDGRDIVSVHWGEGRYFKGATRDGAVFEGEIQPDGVYICPGFSTVEGPVRDALFFDCDGSSSFLVLQENALLGAYECQPIIVVV